MKPIIKQSDVTRNYPVDWLETHNIYKVMSQCVFDADSEQEWIDNDSAFNAEILGLFFVYNDDYEPAMGNDDEIILDRERKKYHRSTYVDVEEFNTIDIRGGIYGTTEGLADDKEWFAVYIPQSELDAAEDDGELFEDKTIADRTLYSMI